MVATAKMGRRKQQLLALTIILLRIMLTIALSGFGFLLLSRIVLGVGSGVFVVTSYATAANLAPVGRQGGAMSNVSMGFSASLVLGVPIGRVVAAAYDWKVIFWGIGLFTLLGIFAVAKAIPSTKGEASVPLGKQLALLKNPKIATALGVTFFVFIGYSVVNTYITPFLTSVMSFSGGVVSVTIAWVAIYSFREQYFRAARICSWRWYRRSCRGWTVDIVDLLDWSSCGCRGVRFLRAYPYVLETRGHGVSLLSMQWIIKTIYK